MELKASCFDAWSQTRELALETKSQDSRHAALVSRLRRRSELRDLGRAFDMLGAFTLEARRMVRAEKALSIRSARRVLERYLELWDQHRNMSNQQTHEIEEEVEASLVFHRTVLRAEKRRMFLDCQLMKRCFYDLANNRIMGLHLRRQIACRRSRLSYRLLGQAFNACLCFVLSKRCLRHNAVTTPCEARGESW